MLNILVKIKYWIRFWENVIYTSRKINEFTCTIIYLERSVEVLKIENKKIIQEISEIRSNNENES